jgi:hypothetical protein
VVFAVAGAYRPGTRRTSSFRRPRSPRIRRKAKPRWSCSPATAREPRLLRLNCVSPEELHQAEADYLAEQVNSDMVPVDDVSPGARAGRWRC